MLLLILFVDFAEVRGLRGRVIEMQGCDDDDVTRAEDLFSKTPSFLFLLTILQVNGVPVDCGFLVFNENTYPNLIGM